MKEHWSHIFFFNFGSEIVANGCAKKKKYFSGNCDSLLMDLGQDQQQHPAVHHFVFCVLCKPA
jgi:hypothetical protein